MRKIFIAATITVMLISNICAAMRLSEFNLGGVPLNMPYDDVIKIYGQPTEILNGYAQLVNKVIMYNDVEIGFLNKKVRYVVTTANNGWKTPAGVYVGMPLEEVIEIYGSDYTVTNRAQEDIPKFMRESGKRYFDYIWHGTKYSWSQVADIYSYEPGDVTFMLSVIVNDNKVAAIKINQITPEY